jgi:glycine reductase
LILSRASGIPVVANAIEYASGLARGELGGIARAEFTKAEKAGLEKLILNSVKDKNENSEEAVKAPIKEIVTGTLSGIDIMELEDAVQALWKAGIYAESGMGCTGPVIMVNEGKVQKAIDVLIEKGFMAKEADPC